MLGAIIGDICGSIYEMDNRKTTNPKEINLISERCHFTDDSCLTVAIADAILTVGNNESTTSEDFKQTMYRWGNKYPDCGFGSGFREWLGQENPQNRDSFANGSAMRVSPVGWNSDSLNDVLDEAERTAEPTHSHPEGIKGAQAVAAAIYLARKGKTKGEIRKYIVENFGKSNSGNSRLKIQKDGTARSKNGYRDFNENDCGEYLDYSLNRTLDELRPYYEFDVTCEGTVPVAILAFLESENFVHSIQFAISVGGDTDTIAAITGSIAEAFYGFPSIPDELKRFAINKLPSDMKDVLTRFQKDIYDCHEFIWDKDADGYNRYIDTATAN